MKFKPVLGIIADDLTGASDTAVQFANSGLRTIVSSNNRSIESIVQIADVVAVSTDSRACNPGEAYRRVFHVAELMGQCNISSFYKKIDSTLRGNLGTELDAVLDIAKAKLAVVAPAFPLGGRTTVGGRQLIGGVPIHKSEFAGDLQSPVTESHIPTLLRQQSRRKIGHLPLCILAAGKSAVKVELERLSDLGTTIVVTDARTDDNLNTIADACICLSFPVVCCGSAGLANQIARLLDRPKSTEHFTARPKRPGPKQPAVYRPRPRRPNLGVLTIVGSTRHLVHEQIRNAEDVLGLPVVRLSPDAFNENDSREGEISAAVASGKKALINGQDLIITVEIKPPNSGVQEHLPARDRGHLIVTALADIGFQLISDCSVLGLILSGGDTARAVCRLLGADGIEILRELQPGIPHGITVGHHCPPLDLITKAGAFGDETTLVKAIRYLHDRQLNS